MRVAEFLIVVLSAVFGAYFYLESVHADKVESKVSDYELEAKIIESDLNRDALARRVYEQQETLSPADQRRYDYIVSEIERKQEKIDSINQRIDELEDE